MEFQSICRVCLAENLQLYSVFDECGQSGLKYSEILTNICNNELQINEFDLLSKNICASCQNSCKEYLNFKETIVLNAEFQLKSLEEELNDDNEHYEEIILNELDVDANHQEEVYTTIVEFDTKKHNNTLLNGINDSTFDGFVTASSEDENGDFPCTKCDMLFHTRRKLTEHLEKHSTGLRLFECSTCQRKFQTEMQLHKHDVIHSDLITQIKEEDEFECIVCKEVVAVKEELDEHMREHKVNIEIEPIQCMYCDKSFDKFVTLTKHLKKHDENKTHLCKVCNKTFALGPELIEHLNRHQGKRPHSCDICGKSYHQASKLKVHLETHLEEKGFLCTECGKSFGRNSNLRQHLLRHSGVKPFQCPQCPSRFISKGNLKAHMTTHQNEKPYVCNICGSRFTQSFSLVKHNRIHTGERPFSCDLCSMRFYSSDHLKRHVRTHTGEKPFKCTYCPKAFAQNGDLNKHKRKHIGENTYICDWSGCKSAFRLLSELRDHHKIHYSRDNLEGAVSSITGDFNSNIA